MKRIPIFITWLTLAALADWLITRTLARAAIFMPKSPVVLQIYQVLSLIGQLATSLTGLLVFLALGWIAWQQLQRRGNRALGALCNGLILASLLALFMPSGGGLTLVFQVLLCSGLLLLINQAWKQPGDLEIKIAITFTGLALLAGRLFQIFPTSYTVLRLTGPAAFSERFFNIGELLVLVSIFSLWWCFGRRAPWWAWLLAALPVLAFVIPRLITPAVTGIMAIWSTGLSLYLPWPLYAVGLWLAGVTALNALRQRRQAGWAILLLIASGYAPQLNIHAFLGLVALWLLVNYSSQPRLAAELEISQGPASLPLPAQIN